MGVNVNSAPTLGFFNLYNTGVVKGTGTNAGFAQNSVNVVLNSTGQGGAYLPGDVYLTTGTAATDTLSFSHEIKQYDPNYPANDGVNYVIPAFSGTFSSSSTYNAGLGTASANYVITAHVQGAGTVKLQSGSRARTRTTRVFSAASGRSRVACCRLGRTSAS